MNNGDIITELTKRLGDRKVAQTALDGIVAVVTEAMSRGDRVTIAGFGTFERQARQARMARNPRTGESVRVRKTNIAKFRPGTRLKAVAAGTVKIPKNGKITPLLPEGISGSRMLSRINALMTDTAGAATARTTTTAPRQRVTAVAAGRTATKSTTARTAAKTAPATKAAPAKAPAKKATTKTTTPARATRTAAAHPAAAKTATRKTAGTTATAARRTARKTA
jgi:DNA-binding protein HU-beta